MVHTPVAVVGPRLWRVRDDAGFAVQKVAAVAMLAFAVLVPEETCLCDAARCDGRHGFFFLFSFFNSRYIDGREKKNSKKLRTPQEIEIKKKRARLSVYNVGGKGPLH